MVIKQFLMKDYSNSLKIVKTAKQQSWQQTPASSSVTQNHQMVSNINTTRLLKINCSLQLLVLVQRLLSSSPSLPDIVSCVVMVSWRSHGDIRGWERAAGWSSFLHGWVSLTDQWLQDPEEQAGPPCHPSNKETEVTKAHLFLLLGHMNMCPN